MFLSIFFAAIGALSSVVYGEHLDQNYYLSTEDFRFIQNLPKARAGHRLPGFKYVYLEPGSHLTTTLNTSRHQLEIAGSPHTSQHSIDVAAHVIIKMTSHMPAAMFQTLTKGTVGLYTAAEKAFIYPEMASLSNAGCGTSCTGSCAHTCAGDGRKYEDIPGLTNSRSVVQEDVFMCSSSNPNLHFKFNILAHEFGHLVHTYATTPAIKAQIQSAYQAAKQHATWTLDSYAMRNPFEYWAVATVTFFGVSQEPIAGTGNMNMCGNVICATVQQARDHLRARDPALFAALSHVYTNNNPTFNPGLTICPPASTVVG